MYSGETKVIVLLNPSPDIAFELTQSYEVIADETAWRLLQGWQM
jgi:hypothetical protein